MAARARPLRLVARSLLFVVGCCGLAIQGAAASPCWSKVVLLVRLVVVAS